MVLGISATAALAGLQFGGKALSALGGFMDNSEQQAKYNADVQRVAAIDAKNQQTRANDLKIFANYNNKKAAVGQQLANIAQEADSQRAGARLKVDRAASDTIMANQDAFIKTQRRLRGGGGGRVNLDGSSLGAYGRQVATNLARVSRASDDLTTSDYLRDYMKQNQESMVLASVGAPPQATPYITKYTPQDYSRNWMADSLKLGTGLMEAGLGAYKTFTSLSPEAIHDGMKNKAVDV